MIAFKHCDSGRNRQFSFLCYVVCNTNIGKIGLKPRRATQNSQTKTAHFLKKIFFPLQLVDVSESHSGGQRNDANVKLIFNQNWRPGVTVSSLLIQRVNKSHNGVFQCIPSNSEAKQIKVHVLKGT